MRKKTRYTYFIVSLIIIFGLLLTKTLYKEDTIKNKSQMVFDISTSEKLLEMGFKQIAMEEGFSKTPYKCLGGRNTIGYGTTFFKKSLKQVTEAQGKQMALEHMQKDIYSLNVIGENINGLIKLSFIDFIYNKGFPTYKNHPARTYMINYLKNKSIKTLPFDKKFISLWVKHNGESSKIKKVLEQRRCREILVMQGNEGILVSILSNNIKDYKSYNCKHLGL